MIYQDLSDWMEEDRYDFPDDYLITVITPGESAGTEYTLSIKNTNKLTFDCIKDGIWCFQTESCGVSYKRYIGIFYSIECCIKKAYATEESYSTIKEVELFLNLTKAAISINNIKEASEYLEIAEKKLSRIKCDCNC